MRKGSGKPVAERFWPRVEKGEGCWLWTGAVAKDGYGKFSVDQTRTCRAHRVAWELSQGEVPAGFCVLHHCDVPLCVNPEHLFLGTNADNVRDRVRKGRSGDQHGERNHMVKLTDEQVEEIKQRYWGSEDSQYTISREFGITQAHMSNILSGKRRMVNSYERSAS